MQESYSFRLPNVAYEQKLRYCLSVMSKQHQEVVPLRRAVRSYRIEHDKLKQEIQEWKEKCQKTEEELRKTKNENRDLQKEIEKLTKTNRRYQVALFDHGNFKHAELRDKKKKGGQEEHVDTNREAVENYQSYQRQRLFASCCGKCQTPLSRVSATRQKILLDIVVNPEVVRLILESERQWCGKCKLEVNARDSRTLPFTEYGMNTFLMVMILRFKCHASLSNIATVIAISHGLKLSKSEAANILRQAKIYLKFRYEKLIKAIRQGNVMYTDETGWLVNGEKAWMWIMASKKTTVYYAAESRGKGIAEELYRNSKAYMMTDGFVSYTNTIPKERHLYCWAHVLRFAYEETNQYMSCNSVAFKFRQRLVSIYHLKTKLSSLGKETVMVLLEKELTDLIRQKTRIISIKNIQKRLIGQKEGLIKALVETPDGTNNLAERELRGMVINKRIFYGSNTFSGMETTAILGSIIQTLSKKQDRLLSSLQTYLKTGIQEKYPQYLHIPFDDS